MVAGGDFVVENVDQIEALLEPALIVAERKKRLEFLDGETIANRRSWMWADETVRFSVSGPNPVVTALSRECRAKTGALVVIHPFCLQSLRAAISLPTLRHGWQLLPDSCCAKPGPSCHKHRGALRIRQGSYTAFFEAIP
jgi:hypothetical protein